MPGPCDPCPSLAEDWQIDQAIVPFVYAPPLAHYLKALKYQRHRELGRALGLLLAAEIRNQNLGVDGVLGVPLHPARLRLRTFNQAHEIARCLALQLEWPLLTGARRLVDTPPQAELDGDDRRRFDRDAFAVPENLVGLEVAIVDDVMTTGATANAFATALKAAGAVRVQAWAVARSIGGSPAGYQSTRRT